MAIVATLVPTPVPAGTGSGGSPGSMRAHVTVTPAGGAGTYNFPHGLTWKPTSIYVYSDLAEGTAPAATNMGTACFIDTNATNVAINVGGNGTYHVEYC